MRVVKHAKGVPTRVLVAVDVLNAFVPRIVSISPRLEPPLKWRDPTSLQSTLLKWIIVIIEVMCQQLVRHRVQHRKKMAEEPTRCPLLAYSLERDPGMRATASEDYQMCSPPAGTCGWPKHFRFDCTYISTSR